MHSNLPTDGNHSGPHHKVAAAAAEHGEVARHDRPGPRYASFPPSGPVSLPSRLSLGLDDDAIALLREKVLTTLGPDMARGLFTGWGFELGQRDAAALGRGFAWENETQALLLSPRLQAWQGAAVMEPKRVAINRLRGQVDLEIVWRRSAEAEQYLHTQGRADHAVCWTLSGYYSGYVGALIGRPVQVVETTCLAMGADGCTIRIRARDPQDLTDHVARPRHAVLEPEHAIRVMHGELERLRFESSMRLNRLEALREAVLDVNAELRLFGVQAKIVSRGRVLLGARYAFLVMAVGAPLSASPPQNGHLGAGAVRTYDVVHDGLTQEDAMALDPFPVHTGLFAAVFRDNATVRVRRVTEDARSRGMPEHPALSSSFLGVPVRVRGQLFGALYFADRLDGGEFSLEDEKLAESFAAHAGVALENARLVETISAERDERSQALDRETQVTAKLHQLREESERDRKLLRALVDLPTLPDLNDALTSILRLLLELTQGDLGVILLSGRSEAEPGLSVQVALCTSPEGGVTRIDIDEGGGAQADAGPAMAIDRSDVTAGGLAEQVLAARDVLYVRDLAEMPELQEEGLVARGVRSVLAAPLLVEDRLIGVLEIGTYAVSTFEESELGFLRLAAGLMALSIDNVRARQEVTRFSELLRAVIEAAPIGMSVRVGEELLLSNEIMRRLGHAGEPEGDAPQRALHGEIVRREERTMEARGEGPGIAVRVSAAPVLDTAGRVQAAVTVVEELTLEKELERLRERFVSLVAHDLRNPLNAALLHLELLRERLETGKGSLDTRGAPLRLVEDSLKTSDAIVRAMMRVSDLVSDLLDYSRIEAGQLTVHPSAVLLPPLLRELLEELRPMLGGRMVEVDIDDDLPPLRADRRRLAQVLTNLLTNALKYTPPGVRMGLRARRAEAVQGGPGPLANLLAGPPPKDPRDYVVLTAWDLGPGIPPEGRAQLFDPFYRLTRDKDRREGTGLGLYISWGLCEAHGGAIWIDDVPGASFSMLWPAAGAEDPAAS